MKDTPIVSARRALLRKEVQLHGQAEVSRRAQKPDRQIGDLIAGRVSFGDKIAKDLEKIRQDLPQGWLVFPDQQSPSAPAIARYPSSQVIERALYAREAEISDQLQELTRIWLRLNPAQRTLALEYMRAMHSNTEVVHRNEVTQSTESSSTNSQNSERRRSADGSIDLWEELQDAKNKPPVASRGRRGNNG